MAGLYEITLNNSDLGVIISDTAREIDFVIPGILIFVFLLIAMFGYTNSKNKYSGRSNIWLWFTIAGLVTTIMGVLINMISFNLVNGITLSLSIVFTVIFAVTYLIQEDN